MSISQNMTIKTKLTAILLLTCVIALAVAGTAFVVWEQASYRDVMAYNLSTQAGMIADSCKAALSFADAVDARQTLRALRAEPSIVYGGIYTSQRTHFVSYYRDGTDTTLHPLRVQEEGFSFDDSLLTVFHAIVVDSETIGIVCLRSDLLPLRVMLRRHISIVTVVLLLALVIAYLVSSRLQGIISGPILKLAEIAQTVTKEQAYSVRAQKQGNDEVGLLIDSFNEMLDQIQRRDAQLVELNENLEETVRRRTAEITTSNEKLRSSNQLLETEVSERKQAEEQQSKLEGKLRQSHKMEAIGTLAGGIAHDFNNILWVIMGNTEMSLRKLPEDSPIRARQEEILVASKRAQDLVEQILTFSRQKEQERIPLQIHLIVQEALKLLEATLPSTIKIHQSIDKDSGTVLADPTEIHQIVMNFCTNAFQAMGEKGGLLGVSLGIFNVDSKTMESYPELHEGSYIELTVSDTGCGMNKATLDRIFEPFFTTKDVGEGTGLGLSTVHGIVTALEGAIKIYSEPGNGSTFRVFIPRYDDSLSKEPMTPTGSPELRGHEHILFVDDETQVVSMVREMLEELGYQITTQTTSVRALEQLSEQPDKFDLVITDQAMPDMTGMELAGHILHIRPDIPVILATGFSSLVTEELIKNSGVREHLKKPIVFHDLQGVVRRVLDDTKNNEQPG